MERAAVPSHRTTDVVAPSLPVQKTIDRAVDILGKDIQSLINPCPDCSTKYNNPFFCGTTDGRCTLKGSSADIRFSYERKVCLTKREKKDIALILNGVCILDPENLADMMTAVPDSILLMDVRGPPAYAKGHLARAINIWQPLLDLDPCFRDVTTDTIEYLLESNSSKQYFGRRATVQHLVVYDQNSPQPNAAAVHATLLFALRQELKDGQKIYLLRGGLDAMITWFPALCERNSVDRYACSIPLEVVAREMGIDDPDFLDTLQNDSLDSVQIESGHNLRAKSLPTQMQALKSLYDIFLEEEQRFLETQHKVTKRELMADIATIYSRKKWMTLLEWHHDSIEIARSYELRTEPLSSSASPFGLLVTTDMVKAFANYLVGMLASPKNGGKISGLFIGSSADVLAELTKRVIHRTKGFTLQTTCVSRVSMIEASVHSVGYEVIVFIDNFEMAIATGQFSDAQCCISIHRSSDEALAEPFKYHKAMVVRIPDVTCHLVSQSLDRDGHIGAITAALILPDKRVRKHLSQKVLSKFS